MQDRQSSGDQGATGGGNLFAYVLQIILTAHGASLSQLYSIGIHPEKVQRLKSSLTKASSFGVLNPGELDKIIQRYSLTTEEQQRLQAALLATAVERVLVNRLIDPRKALAIAEQVMNLIEKNFHAETSGSENVFSVLTKQALQERGASGEESTSERLAGAIAERSLTNYLGEQEILVVAQRILNEGVPKSTQTSAEPSGQDVSLLPVRILENPLTAQNLTLVFAALTELSTKYWLIAKGRFADLIEYTQTHNGRFAEEAQIVITHISYNSPFNMDWKVDVSAPSVAEALVTTIDGIAQRKERLEKAKLDNQAKAQEIKEAEQKAEQENQIALLEQGKRRLELEQQRLEVLEKQLEVQKKGIEYALEIAGKVVDTLYPSNDPATRAMIIQTLLPNIIQLQNGKGLELVLPEPIKNTE